MPETNKIKKEEVKVDLDTSGPEVDVDLPEEKEEKVVETGTTEQEQETVKEVKQEEQVELKKDDEKLEDYSKGVQSRIAKLTRKMREAERREQAAVEYAQAVEKKRQLDQERFQKVDSDFTKKFEENIKTGMDSAQKELAMAIESGDATLKLKLTKELLH